MLALLAAAAAAAATPQPQLPAPIEAAAVEAVEVTTRAPLVGTLKGMARLAIAGYVGGGRATLRAIAANGYDVLRSTPRPGKADTLAMMTRCYVKGR